MTSVDGRSRDPWRAALVARGGVSRRAAWPISANFIDHNRVHRVREGAAAAAVAAQRKGVSSP